MPYDVVDSQPDCSGWATVKENTDGTLETIGCHKTKREAIAQMVAVSIATEHERMRTVAGARGLVGCVDARLVLIGRAQLQLRYNPEQPRDEGGRWTSGGGGAFVDKINDSAVRDLEVQSVPDATDRQELYNEVQAAIDSEIEAAGEDPDLDGEYDIRGFEMMASALDTNGEVHIIPGDFGPDAAMSTYLRRDSKDVPYLEIEYLGTSGGVDGAGTRLFAQALRTASQDGVEMRLFPLDADAESYWSSVGFVRQYPPGSGSREMRLPAEAVKELAQRGRVDELQTQQEILREEDGEL